MCEWAELPVPSVAVLPPPPAKVTATAVGMAAKCYDVVLGLFAHRNLLPRAP
jgi:hypothetical protein